MKNLSCAAKLVWLGIQQIVDGDTSTQRRALIACFCQRCIVVVVLLLVLLVVEVLLGVTGSQKTARNPPHYLVMSKKIVDLERCLLPKP